MTFSCKVKEELCYLKNEAEDEVYEIYGILSYAKIFSESSENILKTENGLLCSKISEILLVVPMPIWNAKFVSAANF